MKGKTGNNRDNPGKIVSNISYEKEGRKLNDLLDDAIFVLRTLMDMEIAFISEFKDGLRIFRSVSTSNSSTVRIKIGDSSPLEESYCARVVDGRLPELIQNAVDLPEALKIPATSVLPVGAHLSAPIKFSNGRVYGTICCFSTTPNFNLKDSDLRFLLTYATFISTKLEDEFKKENQLLLSGPSR